MPVTRITVLLASSLRTVYIVITELVITDLSKSGVLGGGWKAGTRMSLQELVRDHKRKQVSLIERNGESRSNQLLSIVMNADFSHCRTS